ncbi:hypothetical protein NKJ52_10600 [Mesorhizobium australicum]|uniref:hypothetical protein n=1 Tax=Mesorhizobium australicum TaxID=536018 RepID=UPI003338564C
MIGRLNTLGRKLPKAYGWRFRTADAFNAEIAEVAESATDCLPINNFYWRDQLGNWEAYAIMNALRVIDLSRSCVWALGRQDVVCASLLSRSALETAVAFVDTSRTVNATLLGTDKEGKIAPILNPSINLRDTCVTCEELERYSLKTVFSSRLPEADTIYNPTNIVTTITRISKSPGQAFLVPTYGMLCEAAHPNMLGRALYLQGSERGPTEGNELRLIGLGNGPSWPLLAESIVAALSWACAAQVSAFELMAETIGTIFSRIGAFERL